MKVSDLDLSSSDCEAVVADLRVFRASRLYATWVRAIGMAIETIRPEIESPQTAHERTQYLRGVLSGLRTAHGLYDDLERVLRRSSNVAGKVT